MPASGYSEPPHASNQSRSGRNSSINRHRLSESRSRIEVLGHLVGINPAALPPLPRRPNSPISALQDNMHALYRTPSIESIAAVVAQVAIPNAQSLDHKSSLAGFSECSGASGANSANGRSRSRARNAALAQQSTRSHGYAHSGAPVDARPQKSILRKPASSVELPRQTPASHHPSMLRPGTRRRKTLSEADFASMNRNDSHNTATTKLGQSAMTANKSSQATTATALEGAKHVLRDTLFETPPILLHPPVPLTPVSYVDIFSIEEDYSRSGSAGTVTLESYAAEADTSRSRPAAMGSNGTRQQAPTARSRARSFIERSRTESAEDEARSEYSAYSAAKTSYMPRGVGAPGLDEYRGYQPSSAVENSRVVKRRVAELEMLRWQSAQQHRDLPYRVQAVQFEDHAISPPLPPKDSQQQQQKQQRPSALVIPPSQQPAKSFSAISTRRTSTPPSPVSPYRSVSGSPTTSHSSSSRSYGDVFSPLTTPSSTCTCTCTCTSMRTSSTSSRSRRRSRRYSPNCSSRSPSPTRGSYNPAVTEGRRRSQQKLRQASPNGFRGLGDRPRRHSQEDITSWQRPTLKAPSGPVPPVPGARRSYSQRIANSDAPPLSYSSSSSSSRHQSVDRHGGRERRPTALRPDAPAEELFVRGATQERGTYLAFSPPLSSAAESPEPWWYIPAHPAPAPEPAPVSREGPGLRLKPTLERLRQFNFGFEEGEGAEDDGSAEAATPTAPARPMMWAETPPSFSAALSMQKTDPLFITRGDVDGGDGSRSHTTPGRASFFTPWFQAPVASAPAAAAASKLSFKLHEQLAIAPERVRPARPLDGGRGRHHWKVWRR